MVAKIYSEEEVVFAEKSKHFNFRDITGQIFGRLSVIGYAGKLNEAYTWFCKCGCENGNIIRAHSSSLKKGNTTSCGCFQIEETVRRSTTHGQGSSGRASPEYISWSQMIARTQNPKATGYENYGGRGIKVCGRWKVFENFLEDMGRRPSKGHSIERDEVDGNYELSNCRWATRKEQCNNRRSSRFITYNGKTQTLIQWAEETGLNRTTISQRIGRGWPIDKVFSTKSMLNI